MTDEADDLDLYVSTVHPLFDYVEGKLAEMGLKVTDYPQDRWGRYVIPIKKRSDG